MCSDILQLKAERLERLKDDPFYLIDDRPKPAQRVDDVDSIPVVRLDDLPPIQQGRHASSGSFHMTDGLSI